MACSRWMRLSPRCLPCGNTVHRSGDHRRHTRNRFHSTALGPAHSIPANTVGLVHWSVVQASWNICSLVKFNHPPPLAWEVFLSCWLRVLKDWAQFPMATLSNEEARRLHEAVSQLKDTGQLVHPHVPGTVACPPPPPTRTEPPSPLTPSARTNLLRSLNLVEMEGGGPFPKGHCRTAGWRTTLIQSRRRTPTQQCPVAQRAQCVSPPNAQQPTARPR